MIVIGLCKHCYQNLLIIYQKDFTIIDVQAVNLVYMINKDEKLIFRCFTCERNYEKDFNKELIERFAIIYEFCNGDLNKFILLIRKGVYPY